MFVMLCPVSIIAQSSSMTDDQVMQFVLKEHNSGTSQAQIVTKLIQQGVDISQIRRVRKRYERQINDKGLGVVADEALIKAEKIDNQTDIANKNLKIFKRKLKILLEQQAAIIDEIEDIEILD